MKTLIIAFTIIFSNVVLAGERGIVCDRESGVSGCPQYIIHLKKSAFDEYARLTVSEFNRQGICSLTGLVDTKNTDSLSSVVGFLSRKADKLPAKIKLEGEYTSSGGFGLSSKTLVRVQINFAAGNGKLEYRSGKGAFNPLLDEYLFSSDNDPARNEILVNCREIDI